MTTIVVLLGFSAWFVLTVLCQFPGVLSTTIRRFDYLQLIPKWTFFAPNPATTDFRLLVRYFDEHDQPSEFTEIVLYEEQLFRPLWNPARRNAKVIIDSVHVLADLHNHDFTDLERTLPYVLIRNFVRELPRPPGIAAIQFAVVGVEQSRSETVRLLLTSERVRF
jgi:hypothetical protein